MDDNPNKDVELKARVTPEMKNAIEAVAAQRKEKSSVVVREAIRQYLESLPPEPVKRSDGGPSTLPPEAFRDRREVTFYSDDSIEAGITSGVSTDNPPTTILLPPGWKMPVDFVVKIRGDSMTGLVEDGELAAFVKATKANTGDIVAAVVNGQMMLKMYERENGTARLVSLNTNYRPIPVDEHVRIQGIYQDKFPLVQ